MTTGYLYDLFQPEARAYAFRAVEEGYIKPYGLHYWWLDCDEPCGGNMNNLIYNNGTWPAAFVGAAYPHMLDLMVWEGMGAPGKVYEHDTVQLARSAWAGSQRYGGAVWSGDTHSDFKNLNQQFRAGLNMVMSGIPYWTTDIGGYSGGHIDSADFRELIVRWFQWGAFCPLFRIHGSRRGGAPFPPGDAGECGTSSSNEIWNFGPESEAAIVRVMKLREQLRPYIMKLYAEAAKSGTPIMRPLFFDFWEDEGAQTIDDELMFGPSYLVAPQLNQNASSRSVYLPALPKGTVWHNVFTRVETDTSAGGRTITEDTPLSGDGFGTFPLYHRKVQFAYPSPPPLPTCDNSCTITPHTDMNGGGALYKKLPNSSSDADCCAQCKADAGCTSFVRGPNQQVMTCFLLKGHIAKTKYVENRNYGCVRSGVAKIV